MIENEAVQPFELMLELHSLNDFGFDYNLLIHYSAVVDRHLMHSHLVFGAVYLLVVMYGFE